MIRSDQSSSATVGYGTRVWSRVSFANKVRESKVRPPIYTREWEIDDFDETYLPLCLTRWELVMKKQNTRLGGR